MILAPKEKPTKTQWRNKRKQTWCFYDDRSSSSRRVGCVHLFRLFCKHKKNKKFLHHNVRTISRNLGMQINLRRAKLSRAVYVFYFLHNVYVSSGSTWPGAEDRMEGRTEDYIISRYIMWKKQVQKVKWIGRHGHTSHRESRNNNNNKCSRYLLLH